MDKERDNIVFTPEILDNTNIILGNDDIPGLNSSDTDIN